MPDEAPSPDRNQRPSISIPPNSSPILSTPSEHTQTKPNLRPQQPRTLTPRDNLLLPRSRPSVNPDAAQTASPQPSPPATLLAPRPYLPFFTLINNTSSSTAAAADATTASHPSQIHYIFSDDDESEILSAACSRSLQPPNQSVISSQSYSEDQDADSSSSSTSRRKSKTQSRGKGKGTAKPPDTTPKRKGHRSREERVIIVDISENGHSVVSACSLSSSWQVVSASLENAPTFEDGVVEDGEGRGLMLRIEGVGLSDLEDEKERKLGGGDGHNGGDVGESGIIGEEEMHELLGGFDAKMGLLRKIVAAGESWAENKKAAEDVESEPKMGELAIEEGIGYTIRKFYGAGFKNSLGLFPWDGGVLD